jgi:hypothetical protein
VFSSGKIYVRDCGSERIYSFIDYLKREIELALLIAIDFTSSNGNLDEETSLHYYDPKKNQYLQDINQVGNILKDYDSDKRFSCIWFWRKD